MPSVLKIEIAKLHLLESHCLSGLAVITLVTGQSGVKTLECVKRIRESTGSRDSFDVLRVEDYFPDGLREVLTTQSVRKQCESWRLGLKKLTKELPTKRRLVVVITHATYYHQQTRDYFSPGSCVELNAKLRPNHTLAKVVTLIDDVYDVYSQLLLRGEMWSRVMDQSDPFTSAKDSIANLIDLLEWRQAETTASRRIAMDSGVPFDVLPTKHSRKIGVSVISPRGDGGNHYYLSHPITSIRAQISREMPAFPGELNRFAREFLSRPEFPVLFIPTSIDELRIEQAGVYLRPSLTPRWTAPFGDAERIAPVEAGPVVSNVLNPREGDFSPGRLEEISGMLSVLWGCITRQITSRDLAFVDQARGGVIVYRPLIAGRISGGVEREVESNDQLRKESDHDRVCKVFELNSDVAVARITKFLSLVAKTIPEERNVAVEQLQRQWVASDQMLRRFGDQDTLRTEFDRSVRDPLEQAVGGVVTPPTQGPSGRPQPMEPDDLWGNAARREEFYQSVVGTLFQHPLKRYMSGNDKFILKDSTEELLDAVKRFKLT